VRQNIHEDISKDISESIRQDIRQGIGKPRLPAREDKFWQSIHRESRGQVPR
jgi:hypothetical protein